MMSAAVLTGVLIGSAYSVVLTRGLEVARARLSQQPEQTKE